MQPDTQTAQQPQPQQQAPTADPTKSALKALEAALKANQGLVLVTVEDNEKAIKAKMAEARKLLKAIRKEAEPVVPPVVPPVEPPTPPTKKNANISPEQQRQIDLATEQFKQSVQRVDNQILAQYVQAIQNGSYAEAEAILEKAEESQQTHTLTFALLTIGVILLPLYAKQRIQALLVNFGLHTVFSATTTGQNALRQQAEKGAKSHVRTIAKDLKRNLDDAIDAVIMTPVIEADLKDHFEELQGKEGKDLLKAAHKNENIYEYARDLILKGDSRQEVIKKLQENFAEVGKRRANVIAGNEANRIFTLSQFDADEQFLAQNKLTTKAYKRLVSNTGTPEAICKAIIEATAIKPIPFKQDFVKFGVEMKVKDGDKTYKFTPNYEHLKSGHIHANCHCRYELLIKKDDGTFLNTTTWKIENDVDFNPDLHPRAKDGKFGKKSIPSFGLDLKKLSTMKDFNQFVQDAYFSGDYGHYHEETETAVRAYQGHYYDAINLHLRANNPDRPLEVFKEATTMDTVIGNIKQAANIKLDSDATLYRGTDIPYHRTMNVGEKINYRSFTSTTAVKSVAKSFRNDEGATLVITAKKGQNVIVPDLVTYGKRGRTMGEAEVLLPTGAVLTVTRINGDIVYAELN